jgi:regulator of sigma E protease
MYHIVQVVIEFAIVLGIMVLIHELGHFAVAKWCGVRVETFSIGFGPRLFGARFGDTDYRISLLPLGGYVKMAGDVPGETPSGDPGEFNAHPRWHRVLIAFAGPVANFILSFFLLLFLGLYHHEVDQYLDGPTVIDYVPLGSPAAAAGLAPGDTISSFNKSVDLHWEQILQECALNETRTVPFTFVHQGNTVNSTIPCNFDKKSLTLAGTLLPSGLIPRTQPGPVDVSEVLPGAPADRAGLKVGDKIVRMDNIEPHSADPAMVTYLRDSNGAPITLTILRNGQTMTLTVTPEKMPTAKGDSQFRLGFGNSPAPTRIDHLSFPDAVKQSVKDNLDDSTLILRVLKGMFTRHVSVKSLSGPVGIAQQIDVAAQNGYWSLVRLMSSISLNLGIFNLLPIPILDGGMILFLFIESVMRRDLNQKIKEGVYQLAFVCLILFFVFVLYNDITRAH